MKIAIDFDGTIVEHDFPRIGRPIPGALETLRDLVNARHQLILWTCREDSRDDPDKQFLTDAVKFLESNGVKLAAVNESIQDEFTKANYFARRKVYADVYIDDRGLGCHINWDWIRLQLGLPPTPEMQRAAITQLQTAHQFRLCEPPGETFDDMEERMRSVCKPPHFKK